MQTVYLLKDCYKSYNALKKLYNFPDLSTNIIIVDKNYASILYLDKRVKKFPFIINTLPTSIGLIPKIANVLPLEMFMMLKKFNNIPKSRSITPNTTKTKTISIPTKSLQVKETYYQPKPHFYKPVPRIKPIKTKPLIKTIKEDDGSLNIILNK
jgi:hypothetical protein